MTDSGVSQETGMSDLFTTVIVSVISSSAVIGIFVFIVKRYLDGLISTEFDRRKRISDASLDRAEKVSGFVLDKQIGMYPEIVEVVYRIRNILLHGVKQDHAYQWNPQLLDLCAYLTENLYSYQLFVSKEIFEDIHKFKRIAEEALVLYSSSTREDNISDNTEYLVRVEEFLPKAREADTLYRKITEHIKERVRKLGNLDDL